jgi:hypothetical protein
MHNCSLSPTNFAALATAALVAADAVDEVRVALAEVMPEIEHAIRNAAVLRWERVTVELTAPQARALREALATQEGDG